MQVNVHYTMLRSDLLSLRLTRIPLRLSLIQVKGREEMCEG